MSLPAQLQTPVTSLLKIRHPVLLAGMGGAASKGLAAAVSNAGGLGVIGGIGYTPDMMRKELAELKGALQDPTAFGVDLALPQVGGNARKTNHDYTGGRLPALIDIIVAAKARLFVSAVGIPPRWAVDKLHSAGILVMNMVGHPRHVEKALDVGADLICAQGSEGGGHTGDIGTMVLVPQCVEKCAGRTSPLHGGPIHVVAAGGIFDGKGLAASLALGAQAVWVGTRFVASTEATVSKIHKEHLVKAGPSDTTRTLIYSGRPLRVFKTEYVRDWEENRREEIADLTSRGIVPYAHDSRKAKKEGRIVGGSFVKTRSMLMGQAAAAIHDVKPAAQIVDEMVRQAAELAPARALVPRL